MLKLYNYLTRKIEEFIPLTPPKVGMYTCGPTTYDFVHIGNLRTFIFEDIMQRVLETNGYEVNRVMNITDIDDKIIKGAREKGEGISEFSKPFERAFFQDLEKLNIKFANVYPKATEHIGHMIKYIEELIKKDLAYVEEDGSIYFDISKFPNYGKLSGLENRTLKIGVRVKADEYTKDNVSDFALWKAVEPDEVGWDSPWGRGRPGWHIECSVMSQEYLSGGQNQTIDIHAGAIDLLFPHHENEIAQSEGKTGKKFVNFFIEGEHLLVDGKKMAKSAGNFYKLKDVEEKGIEPLALRYLFLTAHYRDKINFTWESLSGAQTALNNLREQIRAWPEPSGLSEQSNLESSPFWQRYAEAARNDLNMPQAVAVLWDLVHNAEATPERSAMLLKMDKILGLQLDKYLGKVIEVPSGVMELVEKRKAARKGGDFKKSDELRVEIKKLGFEVEDTSSGVKLKRS